MPRVLLVTALASTWFACGPMVTDIEEDPEAAQRHETQGCFECAREVCDGLIAQCRRDPECSPIAECIETTEPNPDADPFYECADHHGKLEVRTWQDISECASELCGMCPPTIVVHE